MATLTLDRFEGSTDDLININSLTENVDDENSLGIFWDESEQFLFSMDSGSTTDLLFSAEPDNYDASSILAESSQGDCSFSTSLLPDVLKARSRRGVTCQNPDSSGDDTVPGSSSSGDGAALNVHPSVLPYINLETMELKEICPAESLTNQYYISVCSNPDKECTKQYPLDAPTHWQLMEAQLSKCISAKNNLLSLRLKSDKCMTNLFIFPSRLQ